MKRTIQDVIDLIIASVPGAPQEDSVDVFKCGDPSQEVTGIVTTFTATLDVLRKAVELGANLVITHEPVFYEHREETAWMGDDPILQAKREFLAESGLTIWRFHDYWHGCKPDGIRKGVVRALSWEAYQQGENEALLVIPPLTVAALAATVKERLGLSTLRLVGNLQQPCKRIALLLGAVGGERQIKTFHQWNADVVLCGETSEWQVCEYVRDAIAMGYNKTLMIVGHAKSEEAGMNYLVEWLQPKVAQIPITYIPVGEPIMVL